MGLGAHNVVLFQTPLTQSKVPNTVKFSSTVTFLETPPTEQSSPRSSAGKKPFTSNNIFDETLTAASSGSRFDTRKLDNGISRCRPLYDDTINLFKERQLAFAVEDFQETPLVQYNKVKERGRHRQKSAPATRRRVDGDTRPERKTRVDPVTRDVIAEHDRRSRDNVDARHIQHKPLKRKGYIV